MTMDQSVEEQLQQLRDRIQEHIRLQAQTYRQQLVARFVASGDPDWIMSMFNKQP